MARDGTALRALFLGAPNPLGMGVLARWLRDGNSVAAFWHSARASSEAVLAQDAAEGMARPFLSLSGLRGFYGFPAEAVPRLAGHPELLEKAAALRPDVVVSAMFMERIPAEMIERFRGRIVNLHPALLPAYRGTDPIIDMLWDETMDAASGITLHEVTAGYDEGAIIEQRAVSFPPNCDLETYRQRLVDTAGDILRDVLPGYLAGTVKPVAQPEKGISHCRVRLNAMTIDPATVDLRRVEWLCSTIGQFATFAVAGSPRPIQVNRILETRGAPTGEGFSFGENYAELDVIDARLRLTRVA